MTETKAYAKATSDYSSRDSGDTVKLYYEKEMTNYIGHYNELFITTELRTFDGSQQHWVWRYGVPPTAMFVNKGIDPINQNNRITNPIVICFDIVGFKSGKSYSYNSTQWEIERLNSSGNPINQSKYNKYNVGAVILVDPNRSFNDDWTPSITH